MTRGVLLRHQPRIPAIPNGSRRQAECLGVPAAPLSRRGQAARTATYSRLEFSGVSDGGTAIRYWGVTI